MLVCPKCGFGVVKSIRTVLRNTKSKTGEQHVIKAYESWFKTFTDVAPGIIMPTIGWYKYYKDGKLFTSAKVVLKYHSVNEPIDNSEFELTFPPGTAVVDDRTRKTVVIPYKDDKAISDRVETLRDRITSIKSKDTGRAEPETPISSSQQEPQTAVKPLTVERSKWLGLGKAALYICASTLAILILSTGMFLLLRAK